MKCMHVSPVFLDEEDKNQRRRTRTWVCSYLSGGVSFFMITTRLYLIFSLPLEHNRLVDEMNFEVKTFLDCQPYVLLWPTLV